MRVLSIFLFSFSLFFPFQIKAESGAAPDRAPVEPANETTQEPDQPYRDTTCFIKGTKISTPNGLVPIQRLRVGDRVYAYNHAQKRRVVSIVTKLWKHKPSPYLRLPLHKGKWLGVTANHPVYVRHKGYIRAEYLKPGDLLLSLSQRNGGRMLLFSLSQKPARAPKPQVVYNISVARFQNYFAQGILVHNKSRGTTCSAFGENDGVGMIWFLAWLFLGIRLTFRKHRV